MTENACVTLADLVSELDAKRLPAHVLKRARVAFVDYVSAALAGTRWGKLPPIALDALRCYEGHGTVCCIGALKRYPPMEAALYNGVVGHSVELDDGHRFGTCHPGVAVIPAALAAAESEGASYLDLQVALVAGYEAMLRIATAINPSHLGRGFHTTGTCGSIGAAAAAGRLCGLDGEQMRYALSIGALQGAGLCEMLHGHPLIKPLQPGRAAQAGVLAAQLVRRGAKSPLSVFEGPMGFFHAMTDELDLTAITDALGERYEIERCYVKPWPTCRHVHCSLALAKRLHERDGFTAEDVERIVVSTYSIALPEVGEIVRPRSADEAMFSIPYAVATLLTVGRYTLAELRPPTLEREDINALAGRVSVVEDEAWNAKYPQSRGATMRIELKDGRAVSDQTPLPPGEPETMLSDAELKEKLAYCSEGVLPDGKVEQIAGWMDDGFDQEPMTAMMDVLRASE